MLVPVKWLREYVEINEDVKVFADKMTMTGSKVEAVENLGEEVEGVFVGKILQIDPHPNADKLIITKVDVKDKVVQIVTGAKNVKVGDYIPVALEGAKLPMGVKIKKGKLRGEVSEGMMCSAQELGIATIHVEEYKKDGIYIIDWPDVVEKDILGKDVKSVLGIEGSVIEFEITSNRPDCLSIIGIAREAAVTLGSNLKYPNIQVREELNEDISFDIDVDAKDLCEKYCIRVIKDVKVKSSPYWLQRRLIEAGMRPINNIVDIANFVMLEQGQPLHTFDMQKLSGEKIVVRRANEKEKITTLDEKERELDKDMLVIADDEKVVAIAGVMGSLGSQVDENTTMILLESANFKSESVRLTSKKLGLRSEASSRFEKGIDVQRVEFAMNRFAQLVEMLGAGKVVKGYKEVLNINENNSKLSVRASRIRELIGEEIATNQMIEILRNLEFECISQDDILHIKAPDFRLDIEQEADILEEIARIYGYDKIKSKQIKGNNLLGVKTKKQLIEDKIKDVLTSMGLNEILTYSFVSPKGVDKILLDKDDIKRNFAQLINPLGEETSVMRTTLIPNMLEVMSGNYAKKVKEFYGFELGNTFLKLEDQKMPVERKALSIGIYGEHDFYDLKAYVEELLKSLGIYDFVVLPESNDPSFHPGRCAKILYQNEEIAVLGEMHPDVATNYAIKRRIYVAQIDAQFVLEKVLDVKKYKSLPKYPSIQRDIAVVVKKEIFVSQIEDIIKKYSKNLLESYELFDVYEGEQIEEGYKSVAYSLVYRDCNKTLTDEEVNPAYEKIIKKLEEELDAKLRA